jgi:hypothetical protein
MTKGDIYYGDVNVTLVKAIKKRGSNQTMEFDRVNFRIEKIVFTMYQGEIFTKHELLHERLKRKIPHHLQNHEITNVTMLGGEKVGETSYDITDLIK